VELGQTLLSRAANIRISLLCICPIYEQFKSTQQRTSATKGNRVQKTYAEWLGDRLRKDGNIHCLRVGDCSFWLLGCQHWAMKQIDEKQLDYRYFQLSQ
jgi:hypothetical protein